MSGPVAGGWSPGAADVAIDGLPARRIERPESEAEVAELVARARRDRLNLVPIGGGTALSIGNVPRRFDLAVDLRNLDQIGAYSAPDLVVTAQAGTRLSDLDTFLAASSQVLPLEGPPGATLGGIAAAEQAGRHRFSRGTPRDWLIGARALTGDGRWLKIGAKVVKNVAGYDVGRLLCGSLGSLAIFTELTFKVAPRPQTAAVWRIATTLAGAESIRQLAVHLGAASIELTARPEIAVEVAFEGEPDAVAWQSERLVARFARAEQADAAGGPEAPSSQELVWTFGVLPDRLCRALERCLAGGPAGVAAHLGSGIATLTAASGGPEAVGRLQAWSFEIEALGGWWRLERGPKDGRECFGPTRAEWAIAAEIKKAMDPDGILSVGRMPGGF